MNRPADYLVVDPYICVQRGQEVLVETHLHERVAPFTWVQWDLDGVQTYDVPGVRPDDMYVRTCARPDTPLRFVAGAQGVAIW